MSLEIKLAYENPALIRELFAEYTELLVSLNQSFADYLRLQDFDAELADLDKKYGLPDGRLYLIYWDGQLAGCGALRRLDAVACEIKRLYVRPEFRGKGIARTVSERIVQDARDVGYQTMLLDTLPELTQAIALYERMGFVHIPPYNENPVPDCVFMKLDL